MNGKIQERIENTPELEQYREELEYDWPEQEHADWVATASVAEIIDWALTIRAQ